MGELFGELGGESSKTWMVDTRNLSEFKPGPPLNNPTGYLGTCCAKMVIDGKNFIVVFGGKSTIELLDISTPNQGWIMGKIKLCSCFFA